MKPTAILTAALFLAGGAVANTLPRRDLPPVTPEENNFILEGIIDVFANRRFDNMAALFTPDANYFVLGDTEPFSGDHTIPDTVRLARKVFNAFQDYDFTVLSRTVTSERAILEGTVRGTRPDVDGEPVYKQTAVLILNTVRDPVDGRVRIKVLREYLDLVTLQKFAEEVGMLD
ncbi:hypothetical protein MCOR25_007976 [Pyricularia grisea]|uniref:SnoaL-like domain-containing protein n=1 Tax=Pyricularia grisea TaxID=148305 RepID=A0A6P8BAW9_PYRGI|nr:uncharacterized protein PgNI_04167 [Pyricularia grisea]KAI6356099.1 hypothetical protein MCOR25_007976 [Pyricularia grisea]TLD12933.1 hypothetical protein PgNI_04167 [Pyricularia grisea]